ncbi:MAG: DUF3422 domain-containing protein [Paracoccaceae bacterium]|nr:DUF3422 domain-containing protein [Paracoccaceae bacterium]MDG2257010.1 DUF3422 domain-containing protein [Paracoccaceae bacterium]
MPQLDDHPLRYTLSNELHARPFPSLKTPCRAVFLAIKQPVAAESRHRSADRAHLIDLLDRFGVSHPQPNATHYFGKIGRFELKWEQHTEFVTYTVFIKGLSDRPFDPQDFEVFPADWLEKAPGSRLTSSLIRIETMSEETEILSKCEDWFVQESLALSRVVDKAATIAGDFRIDAAGHTRFAIFADLSSGKRRVGRIAQRICEIETYKSMSMLGLSSVRKMGTRLNEIEHSLTNLMADMTKPDSSAEETLHSLLALSAELESMSAQGSFRFGATGAYETIVNQRIEVLRETRIRGRQTFAEFMMRRYDPAMRTVQSAETRMKSMSARAIRAGELLRTRVDVERSAQNQALLENMDRRADLQLRLQKTVEGLSVVAIGYYAVSLVGYLLYPVAGVLGMSKGMLLAAATIPVVLLVWLAIHRIREKFEK